MPPSVSTPLPFLYFQENKGGVQEILLSIVREGSFPYLALHQDSLFPQLSSIRLGAAIKAGSVLETKVGGQGRDGASGTTRGLQRQRQRDRERNGDRQIRRDVLDHTYFLTPIDQKVVLLFYPFTQPPDPLNTEFPACTSRPVSE